MTFTVIWNPKAKKSMESLEKSVSSRIFKKVDEIKNDPLPYLDYMRDYRVYKLRVGDYRVLLDIDFEKKVIEIQIVDHRKRVYKGL